MDCCFHHLIGINGNTVSKEVVEDNEKYEALCNESISDLISEIICRLPTTKDDDGIWGQLDPVRRAIVKLPRSYPIPEQKPQTRWEKFAKAKGIVKSKNTPKILFDKVDGDYKRKWGAYSLKKAEEKRDIMVPSKPGFEFEDPFDAKRNAKKLAVAKQKLREIKNKVESAGYRLPSSKPAEAKVKKGGAKKTKKSRR